MPAPARSLQRLEAEHRRALLQVRDYDIALDLSPGTTGDLTADRPTFASTSTIRFSSGAGRTFVDVKPVALHAARLDGEPLDVARLESGRLPLDLREGEHELVMEATMAFHDDGEGLHLSLDPADGRAYVYAMSFMDAAPSWFACFDQPDLKAAYSLRVVAPPEWTVVGNAPAQEQEPGVYRLGPTPPISTYVVTLVAGPWHLITDEHDGIALSLSARASLAAVLDRDAEDLLVVTKQSFDALHQRFGIRYPFGDYHQAFVPDFNAGAMENPGCVTFRDGYLSTSRLTRAALAGRASTIAHEMAHQWFGNLVTPTWWDDLWLNESFAEYLGVRVTAEATQYDDIWVDDVRSRRPWGLVADQGPTTHPIAGNGAADAGEALENFDGISYAKGASVLGQLCATLGDEVFFGGVVDHLTRHRFANATMADLIASWERRGAGDLGGFVQNWLLTAGPDRLELDRDAGLLRRTAPAGRPAERTHVVDVMVHGDAGWARQRVTVDDDHTAYDAQAAPVLIDPDCQTWAVTLPDPTTLAALPTLLPAMTDPMLRASTWNTLRNAFHNALLDPQDALELVVAAPPLDDAEDGDLRMMGWVYRRVLPLLADPDTGRARLHDAARAQLESAVPVSETQLAAFRVAVSTSVDVTELRTWSIGKQLPAGVLVDVDLRWRLLRRLAELGAIDATELDRLAAEDPSVDTRIAHAHALASLPTEEAKQWAWDRFTGAVGAPNHVLRAAGQGLWQPGQESLTTAYVERYFEDLPGTVAVRSGWTLAEAAEQFFPWTSLHDATAERAAQLAGDPAVPLPLQRRLAEQADQLRRQLAVLAAYPRTAAPAPRRG